MHHLPVTSALSRVFYGTKEWRFILSLRQDHRIRLNSSCTAQEYPAAGMSGDGNYAPLNRSCAPVWSGVFLEEETPFHHKHSPPTQLCVYRAAYLLENISNQKGSSSCSLPINISVGVSVFSLSHPRWALKAGFSNITQQFPHLLHHKLFPHHQNNPISIQTCCNFFHLNKNLFVPTCCSMYCPVSLLPRQSITPQQGRTFVSPMLAWRTPSCSSDLCSNLLSQ